MKVAREDSINLDVCETCAERGRPNEPVYKLGMCRFCYLGLPHPNATSEQLARERMGAYSRQRLSPLSRRVNSSAPDVEAGQRENHERQHQRF